MKYRYLNSVALDPYFRNLLLLRDKISKSCDDYFHSISAPKVDLYLITNSISSPIGLGSDSKPLPIIFGGEQAMLTDSSQFGMEVLTTKHFKAVYCYLPSFRGENPDKDHLNQFFHCEAEMRGSLKDAIKAANSLVYQIINDAYSFCYKSKIVHFRNKKFSHLENLLNNKKIQEITFDEAVSILESQKNIQSLVEQEKYGRKITRKGERLLTKILNNNKLPVWVKYYDRDVVPFYQKPFGENKNKVYNADLLFPSIDGGFGGEIVGAGQRQDNIKEIYDSISRQGVKNSKTYDWYINLRKLPNYRRTAGFGLGIERLVAWILTKESIHDVTVFPRTLGGSLDP